MREQVKNKIHAMVLSQQKKKITRREKENKVGEETVGEEDGKSLIHHVRVRQK